MGIEINYGNDVFVLPKVLLREKLDTASENDMKVLLVLASEPGLRAEYPESAKAIAQTLNIEVRDVDVAVSFWRGAGVLGTSKLEIKKETKAKALIKHEIPEYSGDDVQRLMDDSKGSLGTLIDECQSIAGKIFSPVEVNKIVAMSDYLKLENEHIMLLFEYCKSKGKTSVPYIEKMTYSLYNEGIDTLQKFEDYMKAEELALAAESKLRKLFGLGDRSITAKEKARFKRWMGEWKFGFEIIEKAYELTVENTGKLSFPYIDKILSSWHDSGFESIERIEEAITAHKADSLPMFGDGGSFDTEEFFDAALRRSYEEIK